ncbi:Conserved_hypothetical protein [Hexamita inflata]|uniref:Kinetochore protein Spc24 n=1 Tax=Hexamita inflata TaxID=28002 RepID=A0AA86RGX5_9EUKA|nr:Conserved hypothetical protein [Hexamita inflata]CAI9974016.1 Conserved hypothetical protein [Hexamita inflata]
MEDYNKLMNCLGQSITDISSGGELSLLKQVIEMKSQLNKDIVKRQINQQQKIQSVVNQLKQQQPSIEPQTKVPAAQSLIGKANELQKQVEQLRNQRNQCVEQLNKLKEQKESQGQIKLTEAQQIEQALALYHQLTGVFWDADETGYVLSEEIAKPIKYCDDLDGTEQLWEMIDM